MSRDNLVGFALLGVCAVVAVVLMVAIVTGERPRLSLNPVASTVLGIAFFGLILFGMVGGRRRSGGGGFGQRQWPDPQTGKKSLWDRLRGR